MSTTDESPPLRDVLRASEERFRFLTETIPVQIWTAEPDGHLDYVTAQTAGHFGLSPATLLRDGWQNVVHPEDLPAAIARWVHALSTGETYEVELRLKLASGAYAYHLARAVPQRDANGAIVRWFGTNTNIDEQREEARRTRSLLDEVATQARENESALRELHAAKAKADETIATLRAQLERAANVTKTP